MHSATKVGSGSRAVPVGLCTGGASSMDRLFDVATSCFGSKAVLLFFSDISRLCGLVVSKFYLIPCPPGLTRQLLDDSIL